MSRRHEGQRDVRQPPRRRQAELRAHAETTTASPPEGLLREALEANGQRFTEQRAAVYRCLLATDRHPSADDVFTEVRRVVPDISLATVYKSLETLVTCGLASKLTYGDGSARYDARTDPHHHARCLVCGTVVDLPGRLEPTALSDLGELPGFSVEGYRFEVVGVCSAC